MRKMMLYLNILSEFFKICGVLMKTLIFVNKPYLRMHLWTPIQLRRFWRNPLRIKWLRVHIFYFGYKLFKNPPFKFWILEHCAKNDALTEYTFGIWNFVVFWWKLLFLSINSTCVCICEHLNNYAAFDEIRWECNSYESTYFLLGTNPLQIHHFSF